MNYWGLIVGLFCFLLIGALHPVVVKAEYYIGKRCWPLFLAGGLICVAIAIAVWQPYISVTLGIAGASLFWSIKELFEQEERVKKGWYPENPKKRGTMTDNY